MSRPSQQIQYSRTKLMGWVGMFFGAPVPSAQPSGSSVDLMVINTVCESGDSWFLFNRGDGTFHGERYAYDLARSVAVGDFNSDGIPDIGTGNGLLLGLGDGYFLSVDFLDFDELRDCGGDDRNAAAFADINADGLVDFLFLLNYLFLEGSPPPTPFPGPGIEETDFFDFLGCSPRSWELLRKQR